MRRKDPALGAPGARATAARTHISSMVEGDL